jgi:DNA invertase Pin-like site-specific DNA recombinase
MKTYAYMRVSTDKQTIENQRRTILEYANKHDLGKVTFKEETISSRKKDRFIYQVIDELESGDTLLVYEISRIGRSMGDINSIVSRIRDKNVMLIAISQNLTIRPNEDDISSHAMLFALSIAAQVERDMISERTRNALQARKSAGVKLGRPAGKSKLDAHSDDIADYLAKGLNLTAISKLIGCNRQTLANWMDLHKIGRT